MHPIRRRKKRPNYGVRTVEVSRGKNGFGFTISGQQPCILSCIVTGSPAETAGLRAGDYLVAVDGRSVSKVPHDDVVRLIGSSLGVLKLQIAENYYSDSSDDDVLPVRPKPKYLHKPRSGGQLQQQSRQGAGPNQQNRIAKVVHDLRTGAMFEESLVQPSACVISNWSPPPIAPTPPPRPYQQLPPEAEDIELHQFVVGYLGTIEIPKQLQPGSKLQIVCACIRKLRAEKRPPTPVLLRVLTGGGPGGGGGGPAAGCILLLDARPAPGAARGALLAEYPSDRVLFCSGSGGGGGGSPDADRRHFGLVTSTEDPDGQPSSACHVFAVDAKQAPHEEHAPRALALQLDCGPGAAPGAAGAAQGECSAFPRTAAPVLSAVQRLYAAGAGAASPHLSHVSSANSSNSDSGIGFRDDCGTGSDRVLLVDVEGRRLHLQLDGGVPVPVPLPMAPHGAPTPPCAPTGSPTCNTTCAATCTPTCAPTCTPPCVPPCTPPCDPTCAPPCTPPCPPTCTPPFAPTCSSTCAPTCAPTCASTCTPPCAPTCTPTCAPDKRLAVRVMPDPQEQLYCSLGSCCSDDVNKTDSVKRAERARWCGVSGVLAHSADDLSDLLSYKLSPKVFGVPRPAPRASLAAHKATHSLEDLTLEPARRTPPRGPPLLPLAPQWGLTGSLQELRSFVLSCYEEPGAPPRAPPRAQPRAQPRSTPRPAAHHHAPLAQPENDDGPLAEEAGGDEEEEEEEEGERENDGVAAWSASFERLLADPAGLHTFAEFLKKEFSHENIYFWVACERYRHLENAMERKSEAQAIFDKHLCLGAPEPVNVDSHARQVTQEQLGNALPDLFLQAQKQIFNLMKFDSYPRFIKSELYKECLLREISGQELPFNGSTELNQGLKLEQPNKQLKKSRSDAEDRRRKSLLPWHRKNRSKSKDRGESEYSKLQTRRDQYDTVSIRSDVTSSRSSLASWDLALRGSLSRQSVTSGDTSERENSALCRVILPDGATTVVQTRHNETVSDLVQRLLEKRGLSYQHFQVFVGSNPKQAVPPDEVSSVLSNKEVRVEPRVVFRLDLPNRKTVGVKSRPGKTLGEVLRPVLHKYGYRLHLVTVCLMSENEVVSLGIPVSSVDNQRLQVLTRSPDEVPPVPKHSHTPLGSNVSLLNHSVSSTASSLMPAPPPPLPATSSASLDEITNRVFEELLQGKTAPSTRPSSDQGSVRSEDWGSEHSSGIFGRFLRRDSAYHDKSKDSRSKGKKLSSGLGSAKGSNATICSTGSVAPTKPAPPPPTTKPPLIAKWKPGAKLLGQSESDELYEGLKRAQRSRLEDQRGTEINFELPDFLKDKENAPQSSKKLRKFLQPRREGGSSILVNESQSSSGNSENLRSSSLHHHNHATFHLESLLGVGSSGSESDVRSSGAIAGNASSALLNHSFGSDAVMPSPRQAQDYFSGCFQSESSPASLPILTRLSDPPPLPPKPKYLRPPAPPRVPAGEITNRQESIPIIPSSTSQTRRPIFLDETVSSFV